MKKLLSLVHWQRGDLVPKNFLSSTWRVCSLSEISEKRRRGFELYSINETCIYRPSHIKGGHYDDQSILFCQLVEDDVFRVFLFHAVEAAALVEENSLMKFFYPQTIPPQSLSCTLTKTHYPSSNHANTNRKNTQT